MGDRLTPRQPKKEDQDQPVSPGRSPSSLKSSVDLHGPMTVKHYISDAETKGLVDFINTVLPDANISTENDELFERVKDGILLCRLLYAIAPHLFKGLKPFKTSFANENRAQFEKIENYKIFLQAAGRFGCNIVNLDATDLLQGTPHLVLGILWQIVKSGLLKQVAELSHSSKLPPEEILMSWFNYHLRMAQWPRVVTNFTSDLSDSENLTVLMNQLAPEQCDRSPLEIANLLKRAESMLANAERIQCRKFVSAEDVVKGDAHLIGFVATIFTKFPIEVPSAPSKSELILNVINKIDVTKLSNAPLEADFSSKETAEQYAMLFDSDDDGYITFDDIKNTLDSQGISISDQVLEQMYQESGKKTTEKLNYEEFVPFLIKFAALNKKKDLEVQAAQQEEFHKQLEELQNQVKNLQADKSSLETQLKDVTGSLTNCNEGTTALKAELDKQKEITVNLQSELEKLRASEEGNQQLRTELENCKNEIRSVNEQKSSLEKANSELKENLAAQSEQYKSNFEQLKQMLQQTKNSLVEQEKIDEELHNELEELKKENDKLKENEIIMKKNFEEKLDLVQKELNEKDAMISDRNASVKNLEEKLMQRQEELNKKNEIIFGLESQIRSATEQNEKNHDQLVKEKSAKISDLEEALKRKNEELSKVTSDLQIRSDELKRSEENCNSLKSSLNEKEKEFAQQLNFSKASITKLETTLTEQKNQLVQRDNDITTKIEHINSQQSTISQLESQLKEKEAELLNKEKSFSERERDLHEKLTQSNNSESTNNTNMEILRNEIKLLKETLLNKETQNEQLQTLLQIEVIQNRLNGDQITPINDNNTDAEINRFKTLLAEQEMHIRTLNDEIERMRRGDNNNDAQIVPSSTIESKIERFVKKNRKWFYVGIGCAAVSYFIIMPLIFRVKSAVNSIAVLPSLDFLKSTKVKVRYDLREVLAFKSGHNSTELLVSYNNGEYRREAVYRDERKTRK